MNHGRVKLVARDRAQGRLGIANRARDCFRMYYRPFGIYGLWTFSTHRIFGWPEEITVQPAGIRNPVHLRTRTSDVPGCDEILCRQHYAIDLPFTPKVIVDVGANIGLASIYYTHRYADAKIVAVEPEAANFSLLARNVKPYTNIFPFNAALWNKDGEIALRSVGPPGDNVGFVAQEGEGTRSRAVTMPTLMMATGIDAIDILKVDIEGAEKEVFESCEWMDNVRCLIIELHDSLKPGCSAAVASVTRDFVTLQKGEASIYHRKTA